MAFSHVSRPVRAVTNKSFASKFITLGRVIQYWEQAVGPDLALKTYPIGMKVRKVQNTKSNQESSSPQSSLSSRRRPGPGKENKDSSGAADIIYGPDPRLRGDDSKGCRDDGISKKEKPKKQSLEAILEIAASSADAPLLHYQKSLILERLRVLLGGSMIVDIKITHAGVPGMISPLPAAKAPSLSPLQKEQLDQAVADVTDPDLRAALERLGGYIAEKR